MTKRMDRREALKHLGAAGATAAALGAGAFWLKGRPARGLAAPPLALPSWAVDAEAGAPSMVIARGSSGAKLVAAALEELGGIERFVAQGDVVMIKPNAAFDRPAWQGKRFAEFGECRCRMWS